MSDRESEAGFVIHATGVEEFEDALWIGNHLKARNGLQRVRTIPGEVGTFVLFPDVRQNP